MSNITDAIKTIINEKTKKRYWPSKNPIDDPTDFPDERNYEEEETKLQRHEYTDFRVSDVLGVISKRIQLIGDQERLTPEIEWLEWLEDVLQQSGKQSIDRPAFLKILQQSSSDVDVQDILNKALGASGGKELYADNVGPYGSTRDEENEEVRNEWAEEKGAMYQNDDEYYDPREKIFRKNMNWDDDNDDLDYDDPHSEMEDEIRRGEEEEQDVSKFDYVNIIPERNGKFTVKGYDSFPSNSVMAGQVRKNFLASFDSAEDAQAAFPTAKMSHPMMEPENTYGHLENEEENEEGGDCQRCGNTGYTMDSGKACDCEYGKFEENGQQDTETELGKSSVDSNQKTEENDDEQNDCHQCGNTGLDLGTNRPCDSCPEGDQFKKGPRKTFKQMFPDK